MPVFRTALIVMLLAAPAAVMAETNTWLSESELAAALSGQAVSGEYASGRKFFEAYNADGSIAYEDDGRTSSGHWSVQAGTFCTIYEDDPSGGCFRVQKVGANCYEFYYVARTESDASSGNHDKPDWTARAWLEGKPSSCKERFSA